MSNASSRPARIACAALFIVLLTFAAYSGSLSNGFVDWDDQEYVVNNPFIKDLSFHSVRTIFSTFYQAAYDPLVFLSFSIEYALFGLNPFYYHLHNTILHCINSALFFLFILLISKNMLLSVISAALFGVHPLHVESVAWITERKDMLSALFFLSAALLYILYRSQQRWYWYGLVVVSFLLSLLSKPAGITLPIILIAYDMLLLNKRGKDLILDKVPLLIVSVLCAAITLYAQKTGGGVDIEVSYSLVEKLYIIYYSYFFYILKTLVPVNLSALYPYPQSIEFFTLLSGAAFITCTLFAAVVYSLRRCSALLFYAVLFCITLVPGLKVIPFGNALVADRFMYIPSMGLLPLFAMGIAALFNQAVRRNVWFGISCSIGITACFALLTYERCTVWNNSMALWSDTVSKSPNAELARYGLASAYWKAGDVHRAIAEYRAALKLAPTFVDAYVSLGNALRMSGKRTEAKELLSRALAFNAKKTRAYLGLADLYREDGKLDDALLYYEKAAADDPLLPEAYIGTGHIYRRKGMHDRARTSYDKALALNPDSPSLHTELGLFYREQGNSEAAINQYNRALALDPQHAEASNNLGWIYQQQGDVDRALQYFEKAVESNPSLLTAYDNMVQVYLKQNRAALAVATYKRCLAANVTAEAFQRLVSLYFRLGMKDEIITQCAIIKPESPLYVDSLLCLGDYYRKEGNIDTALDLYQTARKASAADPRILFSLGMALLQQNKISEAQEKLEQAQALGLTNAALSTRLGIIYVNQNMTDKAVRAFTEALALDGGAVLPHLYLGQLYSEKLQDSARAVYHFKKVLELNPAHPRADAIREDIRRLENEIR
jgi:tetratricopeptide (TPR) repeat protein